MTKKEIQRRYYERHKAEILKRNYEWRKGKGREKYNAQQRRRYERRKSMKEETSDMHDEALQYVEELTLKHSDSLGSVRRLDFIAKELRRYKAIEKELGIDLVTFHKALKNGVYYKVTDKSSTNFGKIFFDRYVLWGWNQNPDGTHFAIMQSQSQSFNLKDYGKTWALSKEELE